MYSVCFALCFVVLCATINEGGRQKSACLCARARAHAYCVALCCGSVDEQVRACVGTTCDVDLRGCAKASASSPLTFPFRLRERHAVVRGVRSGAAGLLLHHPGPQALRGGGHPHRLAQGNQGYSPQLCGPIDLLIHSRIFFSARLNGFQFRRLCNCLHRPNR